MTRRTGRKKSEFSVVTDVQTTDRLDVVRNSENVGILLSDFITGLGVSGPLQDKGDAAALPVLDVSGGVNYIRKLLAGNGVAVTYTATDGLKIAHNLTANATYAAIIPDAAITSPVVRSLKAGANIAITEYATYLEIASTLVPATSSRVEVYAVTDLPTAVSGVITLADDTVYEILAPIDISSDRLQMGANSFVYGSSAKVMSITYTGSGSMLTGVDKSFGFKGVALNCTNGTLISASDTTSLASIWFRECQINCDTVGSIASVLGVLLDSNRITCTTDGLTFSGTCGAAILSKTNISGLSGANDGVDLNSATFELFSWTESICNISTTGAVLKGAASSANITSTGIGVADRVWNSGTSNTLGTIVPHDVRWSVKDVKGELDSAHNALSVNSGETITIAAAATPVVMGVANWSSALLRRFTATATGRFTYIGRDTYVKIDATLSVDIASGTDNCTFFVAKNGAVITDSGIQREIVYGSPGNITLMWGLELATNDYIEIWCQNDDTSTNIVVVHAVFRAT